MSTKPFEDFLHELELLETFQQQGRLPGQATPDAVPKIAAKEVSVTTSRSPVLEQKFTKPAVTAPMPIDPARASRIAAMDWAALKAESATCAACGLCKQRKQAVFGVGAESAPWLFVGEGPGAEEDQEGEPFVGQSGKLLDAMLAAAGLQRGREVYIANVVKCRPPGNRTPTLDEATACAPLLDRQVDLIQPKLIVALGKTAVMRLTGSDASMASMRGTLHEYRGIAMVATYHPSYLLRSLTEKLKAWEDMVFAKREMARLLATAATKV